MNSVHLNSVLVTNCMTMVSSINPTLQIQKPAESVARHFRENATAFPPVYKTILKWYGIWIFVSCASPETLPGTLYRPRLHILYGLRMIRLFQGAITTAPYVEPLLQFYLTILSWSWDKLSFRFLGMYFLIKSWEGIQGGWEKSAAGGGVGEWSIRGWREEYCTGSNVLPVGRVGSSTERCFFRVRDGFHLLYRS